MLSIKFNDPPELNFLVQQTLGVIDALVWDRSVDRRCPVANTPRSRRV
jgi:hypothetical protein